MDGLRAHLVFEHPVENADIGKSASSHDEIVSSPGSISVEIFLFNALGLEEACCWRVASNIASWGNVVSSNGVSEDSQDVCILNGLKLREFFFDWLEERRVVNVSGGITPLEVY
jgi:hypothetical protein